MDYGTSAISADFAGTVFFTVEWLRIKFWLFRKFKGLIFCANVFF